MVISDLPIDSVEPFWALPDSIILGSPAFLLWDDFLLKNSTQEPSPQKKMWRKNVEHSFLSNFFGAQRFLIIFSTPFTWVFFFKNCRSAFKSSSVKRSAMLPGTSKPGMSMSFTLVCLSPANQRHGGTPWKSKTFKTGSPEARKKSIANFYRGRFSMVIGYLHPHDCRHRHLRRHNNQ